MENQWLASLDASDRSRLEPHLEPSVFRQGQVLHEAGAASEAVWFPTEGAVSLLTVVGTRRAVETAVIGSEGLVGATCGPLNGGAMTRAVAQTDGEARCIEAGAFSAALAESEGLRAAIARHTEALFAQVQQIAACNAEHLLEERFARWLLMLQDRVQSDRIVLTQQSIADMLAVRRATVSDVAASLEARGLIRRSRGQILILDRSGLEGAACTCYGAINRVMTQLDLAPATDA